MSVPAPLVANNYDISVHGREGATILLLIPGTTAGNLSFEIVGAAAIGLTATATTDQYQLVIPQAVIDAIPGRGALFALRLLGGTAPIVLWEGVIKWRGFVAP